MIQIFKRPGCVYCPAVMKYLDHIGVKYEAREAEGADYEKLSQQFGFSVPLVFNPDNERGMVGYNIGQLRTILDL